MKVRVGDLRQWAKAIPKVQTIQLKLKDREGKDVNREVKVKQRLDIEEKLELLYLAYSVSLNSFANQVDENVKLDSVYGVNLYKFHITYTVYLIKYYTNISLPENVVDAYNLIQQIGLSEIVLEEIPQRELDELEDIKNKFLQTKKDGLDKQADITIIIKEFFEGVLNKLPNKETIEKYMSVFYENE